MGIKSYIRMKIINVLRFAIREEINTNPNMQLQMKKLEDDTIQKIDKKIEQWTWERFKRTDKSIEQWTWERFQRTNKSIEQWTWERFKRTNKSIERWTWERFQRTSEKFKIASEEMAYHGEKIPYYPGEKIRLVILFQIPSCWPSIESVYDCLMKDERYQVTMLLFDKEQREKSQMAGAADFLIKNNIPFERAEYYDFVLERPHIMLYQTPWDDAHRKNFLKSDAISALGIRIAYIPYGINYSASVWPDFVFSDNKFKVKPWLMFCLSKELKVDHQMFSSYGGHHVIATGLPKFDSIYHKENFKLSEQLLTKINGRKVVFMQMHFADKEGNPDIPVPHISEYLKFINKIIFYHEYFFLVRPHPKFFEVYLERGYEEEVNKMRLLLDITDNVYLYNEPDYRPALLNADCVIGDRSALMVESAALDIPVLYLTNFYYQEQMLPSIRPIFDSYYQGNTCYDIELFIDLVMDKGYDYKKQIRIKAKEMCIPDFDGKAGKRIVDTMANVINLEKGVK